MRVYLHLAAFVALTSCGYTFDKAEQEHPPVFEVNKALPAPATSDPYQEFRTEGQAPVQASPHNASPFDHGGTARPPAPEIDAELEIIARQPDMRVKSAKNPEIDSNLSRLERLKQNPVVAALPEEDVVNNVFKPATGATESFSGGSSKKFLGKTVVSLGPTTKPGLWVSAPFIKKDGPVEVTSIETGLTVEVQAAHNEALAQMSLAAFQALQLSPTRLVEVEFRGN